MTQQTAIEWLIDQVQDFFVIPVDILEQAEEMNKQQHGQTWDAAIKAHDNRGHVHARSLVDFDEYYNEKFNKTQAT
jgi:hypothetical protein